MDDQIREYISDITEYEVLSDCCGAPVILTDICTKCFEHCEPENNDDNDKN